MSEENLILQGDWMITHGFWTRAVDKLIRNKNPKHEGKPRKHTDH